MRLFLHKYENGLSSWKEPNRDGVMMYELYSDYKNADGSGGMELIQVFYSLKDLEDFIREYINNDIQKVEEEK